MAWDPFHGARIAWPAVTGRVYDVLGATGQPTAWIPMHSATGLGANVLTWTNPAPAAAGGFYRIRVRRL